MLRLYHIINSEIHAPFSGNMKYGEMIWFFKYGCRIVWECKGNFYGVYTQVVSLNFWWMNNGLFSRSIFYKNVCLSFHEGYFKLLICDIYVKNIHMKIVAKFFTIFPFISLLFTVKNALNDWVTWKRTLEYFN